MGSVVKQVSFISEEQNSLRRLAEHCEYMSPRSL